MDWMPRSPLHLAVGLVAIALSFFVEWRGWWNGVLGLVGVTLLAMWVYRASKPGLPWWRERRSLLLNRRRRTMRVALERRHGERRLAA